MENLFWKFFLPNWSWVRQPLSSARSTLLYPFQMLSAKQGSSNSHLLTSFGMTRPGIEPTTSRLWGGRSTDWANTHRLWYCDIVKISKIYPKYLNNDFYQSGKLTFYYIKTMTHQNWTNKWNTNNLCKILFIQCDVLYINPWTLKMIFFFCYITSIVFPIALAWVYSELFFNGLKPMYSFGKWWKWKKFSNMGFVYRVVWILKVLWIFLSETINIFWENCIKLTFSGFYHRVMYIAPSSGNVSLNCYMDFKLILRRFEVVLWCLEWECCTFWKIDGNSFKPTNTILWL